MYFENLKGTTKQNRGMVYKKIWREKPDYKKNQHQKEEVWTKRPRDKQKTNNKMVDLNIIN
jgi:hypothetical protein